MGIGLVVRLALGMNEIFVINWVVKGRRWASWIKSKSKLLEHIINPQLLRQICEGCATDPLRSILVNLVHFDLFDPLL